MQGSSLPADGVILAHPAQKVIVQFLNLLHSNDLRSIAFGHWLALQ
jgi:hypothetical protein